MTPITIFLTSALHFHKGQLRSLVAIAFSWFR